MTAASVYWPETKRLRTVRGVSRESWVLDDRGQADGVGSLYREAWSRGELKTYSGRVTPWARFYSSLAAALEGVEITGAANLRSVPEVGSSTRSLEAEGLEWPWSFRRMGEAGPQGSADVRAFQRAILRGRVFARVPSLLMSAWLCDQRF